jgi:CRP-like cAMP-binding protein
LIELVFGATEGLKNPFYRADQVIFHQGNATPTVYVTEQSSVKIFTRYKGADIVIQHLGKGNIIGEIALVRTA